MFTQMYNNREIKEIAERISTDSDYELREDIASLGMQLAIQDKLLSQLLLRVSQLEDKLPLIGI